MIFLLFKNNYTFTITLILTLVNHFFYLWHCASLVWHVLHSYIPPIWVVLWPDFICKCYLIPIIDNYNFYPIFSNVFESMRFSCITFILVSFVIFFVVLILQIALAVFCFFLFVTYGTNKIYLIYQNISFGTSSGLATHMLQTMGSFACQKQVSKQNHLVEGLCL